MANRPTLLWNESNPADSDAFSEGDNRIRELKKQFRQIFETDHVIESSGKDSTWGYHKKATFIEQGTDEFIVGATNNKLDFDIGGGELVATVTSATYTDMGSTQADAGSLCKAIYDAIVAAEGAGTYTVTHDGAKMTITRSAGELNLLWKTGTNGADGNDIHIGSLVSYSDLADDTGALTYTADYNSGDPAAIADAFLLYTKQVNSIAELFMQDEDANIMQLTSAGDFIGGMANEIRMWSGLLANIPFSWAVCDGNDGRKNLYHKFLRGVTTASTDPGDTGGNDTITLSSDNLISHAHSISGDGAHTHHVNTGTTSGAVAVHYKTANITNYIVTTSPIGLHNHELDNQGSTTAIDNMPAYYELIFIQRS